MDLYIYRMMWVEEKPSMETKPPVNNYNYNDKKIPIIKTSQIPLKIA